MSRLACSAKLISRNATKKHFLLNAQIGNHVLSLNCSFVIHFCTERKVSVLPHNQNIWRLWACKILNTKVTVLNIKATGIEKNWKPNLQVKHFIK